MKNAPSITHAQILVYASEHILEKAKEHPLLMEIYTPQMEAINTMYILETGNSLPGYKDYIALLEKD